MKRAILKSLFLLLILPLWNCFDGKIARVYGPIAEDTARKITEINYKKGAAHKPRIAIVSHYTTDKENLGFIDLATQNHRKYARLHGYDYYFRNGTITEKYFWPQGHNRTFQLGLYWQKVEATKQLLDMKENGENVYDYVMWLDTDAFFTNIYWSIDSIINSAPKDTFFIVAEDLKTSAIFSFHSCLNSGVYVVKNTPEGRNFIDLVGQSFDVYKSADWPEQLAMADIVYGYFNKESIDDFKKNPDKVADFISKIKLRDCSIRPLSGVKIMSMRELNGAYPLSDIEEVAWNEHSLVSHFLGLSGPQVERYARVLLECLEQSDYKNRAACNPYDLNIILR